MVAGKLPAVPRYRQKVRFVPLQLGRPVWVDDPHFNLGYHLRHTALAVPGGDRELRNLVGRVMSQQLDRHKPLWEMWMVEGLEHGHWALVSKVHHCMVDGVSGTDLLTVVLDSEPEPAAPCPTRGTRRPSLATHALVVDALVDLVASPYEQLRAARSATRAPRQVARAARRAGTRTARVDRRRAADPAVVAQRSDRSAPPLGLGAHDARRREDGAQRARRHGERRRAHRAHARLSRPAARARRGRERPRRAHARAGVGAHARRARHVQQSRLGDDRRAARRPRRSRRTARRDPRADGRAQGVEAGGRRRGAHVACRASRRRCCSRSARASRCGSRSATSTR